MLASASSSAYLTAVIVLSVSLFTVTMIFLSLYVKVPSSFSVSGDKDES